jgi:hypothetical protein
MENRFNNRDFEQFVKQNADQYRMFPSEKVWDNIHSTLHVRKRWYGAGIVLLFITVATVTLVMVNHPDKNQSIAQSIPPAQPVKPTVSENKEVFIAPSSASVKHPSDVVTAGKHHPSLFISDLSTEPVADEQYINTEEFNTQIAAAVLPAVRMTGETEKIQSAVSAHLQHSRNNAGPGNRTIARKALQPATIQSPVAAPPVTADNILAETTAAAHEMNNEKAVDPLRNILNNTDSKPATEAVRVKKNNKKLTLQAYITPLISYRDLKENKAFIRAVQTGNLTPMAYTPVPDVKKIVTHKPDMGIQLGFSAGYPITRGISLIGGVQLTVSKYDIKAYTHPSEVTTIALSSAAGGTNTVSTYTNYRNIGGYKADWLRNLYVSASIPVGLEVKLLSNRKGYLGVSGTVQPTYVIDNRSYLLSTDFKNYAQIPSLIRKVNLNTGFELFVVNNTGKIQWRVGPQVRYQTMSSFKKKYPVEEHLFDFGLKLGVSLR